MFKDCLYQKLIELHGNPLVLSTISAEEDEKVLALAEELQMEGKIKIIDSALCMNSVYLRAEII